MTESEASGANRPPRWRAASRVAEFDETPPSLPCDGKNPPPLILPELGPGPPAPGNAGGKLGAIRTCPRLPRCNGCNTRSSSASNEATVYTSSLGVTSAIIALPSNARRAETRLPTRVRDRLAGHCRRRRNDNLHRCLRRQSVWYLGPPPLAIAYQRR